MMIRMNADLEINIAYNLTLYNVILSIVTKISKKKKYHLNQKVIPIILIFFS